MRWCAVLAPIVSALTRWCVRLWPPPACQPSNHPRTGLVQMQAAHAFRDVTVARVTVNEPMPDLLSASGAVANEADRDPFGRPHRPPSDPNAAAAMRAAHQAAADGGPAPGGGNNPNSPDGAVPHCERMPADAAEERMQMVFDDREHAQDSGEHMQNVAEQWAPPPPSCSLHDSAAGRRRAPESSASPGSRCFLACFNTAHLSRPHVLLRADPIVRRGAGSLGGQRTL